MVGKPFFVLLIALSFWWPITTDAAYMCPQDLSSYDTPEECAVACPGVDCIESGTYMCSADTDGNGENELYKCVQVSTCPLDPNAQCDENGQCSKYVQCTNNQIITSCILSVSPMYGNTYTITTTPGSTVCVEVNEWGCSCEASVDVSCKITSLNSPGAPWGGCGDLIIYSQAQYKTEYECSLNGQTYLSQSECQSACVQTVTCTSSWECPVEGGTACEDFGDPNNYEDDSTDLSYYQNDGQYDQNGQCLGQIYIFSGRPMKCRPPGLQTGFNNCCDADDDIVDAVGNQLNLMKGTLALIQYSKKLYEATKIASTAMQAYDLFQAGYTFKVFNKFPDYADIVRTATSATDAAQKALTSMIGLSPSSVLGNLALSIAMDFVMDALLGGCSERDVITAAYRENGLCHYVGKKCVKKIPLIGCVQKAKIYCCFNSVLARIIHEQGRPQLDTFGLDGGWGTADEPYCRGFRPEEFQMIDFSRIDFSEYVTQYSDTLLNRMPKNTDLEQKMKTKVQDFFGNP